MNSFLVRASLLLALLAFIAWCWPARPVLNAPLSVHVESPKTTVDFATSEDAIQFALERFAEEQQADGSWRSKAWNEIETTAIVLHAFQQAGQTHRSGEYCENVHHGMTYLITAANLQGVGPAKRLVFMEEENPTRTQSLATLAICELYSMTHDKQLGVASQQAANELCEPAHLPRADTPDDVVFWQVLALAEAHMAYLKVSAESVKGVADWHRERIPALPEQRRLGYDYHGVKRFSLLPRDEREALFVRLCESSY